MTIQDEVAQLIHIAPQAPDYVLPDGATQAQLEDFTSRTGMIIPVKLAEWLHLCNGPRIGPGGIFGMSPLDEDLLIESYLLSSPSWKEKGWIPVAGDGCGNVFVLDSASTFGDGNLIYFVDKDEGYETASYTVASDIWHFLRFLLLKDVKKSKWPFNKEEVLSVDTTLLHYTGDVPLPWES